jgi:DNA-binding NarL/FixJ family response regulator
MLPSSETRPIRVLLVDDSFVVRNGLRASLNPPAFQVVGEAGTGAQGLDQARVLQPDVILMDVRMPDLDGISATRRVLEHDPQSRVVILTWSEDGQTLLSAVKAGAKGYLVHGHFSGEELRAAIQTVFDGGALITPSLAPLLLEAFRQTGGAGMEPVPDRPMLNRSMLNRSVLDRHDTRMLGSLTPREQDILQLIQAGLTNREIASRLGIVEKTVKNYISNIYAKLSVSDRQAAARFPLKPEPVQP